MRLDLAEYDFIAEHIPRKENVAADALSRIHIEDIKKIRNWDEVTSVESLHKQGKTN